MSGLNETHRATDPAGQVITVLLADDHPALRAGLRSLLSTEVDIEVVGEVSNGEEAYAWYRERRPDVVVMDLSMAGSGGMESLRRILQFDPKASIIIYSVHATEVMLNRALALGALGYVTKGSDTGVLIDGIREVAERRGFVSPDLIHAVVQRHTHQDRSRIELLSPREFQILMLTAQGYKPDACAESLDMSEKTARNHLTRIKAKLNVVDTADLVRLAIRAGLVEP